MGTVSTWISAASAAAFVFDVNTSGTNNLIFSGGINQQPLSVNDPYVTWIYADRPCGQTAYVSVTNTQATSSATIYTVHDNTGQIDTILVNTGATASANVAFTISARTLQVKDPSGEVLSTRVFTCGVKKSVL